jgi:RNA polymerase sigma factor (sigma-70 family)
MARKEFSSSLCASCNQPLSPMSKKLLCFQCLCSKAERKGGPYFRALSVFVVGGVEDVNPIQSIVQHWVKWRLQMEVCRFHDTIQQGLDQQSKIPEISLRDYMLQRSNTIHKRNEETQILGDSIVQDEPLLQAITGVLLISEAIHCRRLWRRYLVSSLRLKQKFKSATNPNRDLLLEALFRYRLHCVTMIAGFSALRRAHRKGEELYNSFGEAAKAILECIDSFTFEYSKHEIELVRGDRHDQAIYELSSLIFAYAPYRRNKRLFAGLQELASSSNMTPKDVLIDLLPSQVEQAILQKEPTDRLIKGRNSFRNRVLSQLEKKPANKQELMYAPDDVEKYREKAGQHHKWASETEEFIMQEDVRQQTRRLFDEANLSLRQRQVLERAYFEGLQQQEIADDLGLNVNCVKTHRLRGIKKLKQASDKLGISHTEFFL